MQASGYDRKFGTSIRGGQKVRDKIQERTESGEGKLQNPHKQTKSVIWPQMPNYSSWFIENYLLPC